jgi:hypothetical protein
MEDLNYLSLFDYLGKAAGSTLGKQVAEAAKEAKVPHEIRYVSNPTYTGNVMLYPKSFLDDYFKEQ